MDLGAKGRGSPVTLTLFILVLAPACAQGVGLGESGDTTPVTATGTGSTAADTSAGVTEPDSSSGEPDDTGATEGTSTGDESTTGEGSSSGDESTGDGTTGDDLPQAELYPFDRVHSPISAEIANAMRAIAVGVGDKNPAVFTRVGGSISASVDFQKCFADDVAIQGLPAEPGLATTIGYFRTVDLGGMNAWNRDSGATMAGWNTDMLVAGMPTPVGAELTAVLPRFAHVLLGTHDLEKVDPQALWVFASNLLDVVDELTDAGVVPVLSTIPARSDKPPLLVPRYNGVIRAVAQGRQIPLLDLNLALSKLPMTGLAPEGVDLSVFASAGENRPCYFSEAALQFGYNVHNLESLRALDRSRRVVIDVAPSLDPAGPMLLGTGTAADPIRIPSLPFVDLRSTADSPSDIIDNYGGACDGAVDESGPERFYRLEIQAPVTVRAMVFNRDPVDVDIHVLTGKTADKCIKRHEQEIGGPLPPGTYYIAVDSNGGMVPGGAAGEYALVILPE